MTPIDREVRLVMVERRVVCLPGLFLAGCVSNGMAAISPHNPPPKAACNIRLGAYFFTKTSAVVPLNSCVWRVDVLLYEPPAIA